MTQRKGGAVPRGAAPPDLVYTYKHSGSSEELRYSLRSVCKNADGLFGKVWLVGDCPSWAVGVEHLRAASPYGRAEDVRVKVAKVVNHPGVADTFVLMNDDFFLTEPITQWLAWHQGPASEFLQRQRERGASRVWMRPMQHTADWMAAQGYGDVLVRQGHRPVMWDKARLREALNQYPPGRPLDVLGLFDLAGLNDTGKRGGNSKITSAEMFHRKVGKLGHPWISTSDAEFATGITGKYVRDMFPEPCRYEEADRG